MGSKDETPVLRAAYDLLVWALPVLAGDFNSPGRNGTIAGE